MNNRITFNVISGGSVNSLHEQLSHIVTENEFQISNNPTVAEVTVFYGGVPREDSVIITGFTIFVVTEPPEIRKYSLRFLQQFDLVLAPDFNYLKKLNNLQIQGGLLEWSEGIVPQYTFGSKLDKNFSAIFSYKKFTKLQRKRIKFYRRVAHQMPELDLYGRGHNPIANKGVVLSQSKYHLAIENSSHRDYFTEKLTDPILMGSHVFYFGCSNIYDYFDSSIVTLINLDDFVGSIKVIQEKIQSTPHNRTAVELITQKYNLFSILDSLSLNVRSTKKVVISDERIYRLLQELILKVKSLFFNSLYFLIVSLFFHKY
jgi:hypothetical protein